MIEVFRHHPLVEAIPCREVWAGPGFEAASYGALFRDWLMTGEPKGIAEGRNVKTGLPAVAEDYFEWIALLTAVSTAAESFRIFELGAGWGRWSTYAAMACRERGIAYHIVALEPEPSHFLWLEMVLRDNGLDPARHDLRRAALATGPGTVTFAGIDDPHREYGHYVVSGMRGWWKRLRGGHSTRTVETVGLGDLLGAYPRVDLMDLDVQGMEAEALASIRAEQLAGVRIIHIGTHGRDIEEQVRQTLAGFGWLNVFSFPCYSEQVTPYGNVQFQDGVETWVNPRHAELVARMRPPKQK